MSIDIMMPALSPTMEEGVLLKWLIKEGDTVKPGDIIAEIETDKATMEVECIDQGVVGKILIPAGTNSVKVNTVIAILLEEGETLEDIKTTKLSTKPDPQPNNDHLTVSVLDDNALDATYRKKEQTTSLQSFVDKKLFPTDQQKVFSSPLARRIAQQKGLDIHHIKGSGPHGRVIKLDVENAEKTSTSSFVAKELDTPFTIIPQDNLRKTIARRLTESKANIPHFYLKQDCRIDRLISLRCELNQTSNLIKKEINSPHKISINDMVIRALALALRDVPDANVAWSSQGDILLYKHVGVSVAVSIPGGIITPIIQQAEIKSLQMISQEMKDLVVRAKEKKLKPEEYQGGTTSISNLGMFGIDEFSAILNPPQATILAVGAGRETTLANNGNIEIGNIMTVTLSVDHRAIDGAPAAQMIQAFKYYIEHPLAMLL